MHHRLQQTIFTKTSDLITPPTLLQWQRCENIDCQCKPDDENRTQFQSIRDRQTQTVSTHHVIFDASV